VQLTRRLTADDMARLYDVTRESLRDWENRLKEETGERFPEKVTAFHPGMGAHGKYGEPCPQCGMAIQRIVYAERETNYCPTCQTGGRLLADRGLSRLLGKDWPKSVDELEELRRGYKASGDG
jgi:formamidopyrimidine-DNA glycosylase